MKSQELNAIVVVYMRELVAVCDGETTPGRLADLGRAATIYGTSDCRFKNRWAVDSLSEQLVAGSVFAFTPIASEKCPSFDFGEAVGNLRASCRYRMLFCDKRLTRVCYRLGAIRIFLDRT